MGRKISFSLCFMLLIGEFAWVRIDRHNEWFPYYMTIGISILVIMCILLLYTEKPLRKLHVNIPVTVLWSLFSLAMIVSEILVPKRYNGVGVLLLCLLILYYALARSPFTTLFYEGMIWAMKGAFVITCVYQFLFRQEYEEFRYSGFLVNPNVYGLFLITVFCVFAADLLHFDTKKRWVVFITDSIGLGFCLFFIIKTQARTSLLTVVCLTLSLLITRLIIYLKDKEKKFLLLKMGIIAGAIIICYPVGSLLLANVPGTFFKPIEYSIDWDYLSDYDLAPQGTRKRIMQEAKIERETRKNTNEQKKQEESSAAKLPLATPEVTPKPNHIISSLQKDSADSISSGRFSIYESYGSALNWKGHVYIGKKVNGKRVVHAHNNILQFAYTYGIGAGILFAVFEIYLMIYSFIMCIKKGREDSLAFLSLGLSVGFVVATITECVFLPFQAYLALFYYLMSGRLFYKE